MLTLISDKNVCVSLLWCYWGPCSLPCRLSTIQVSTSDRRNVKAVPLSLIRVCVADHGVLLTVPMLAPALLRK